LSIGISLTPSAAAPVGGVRHDQENRPKLHLPVRAGRSDVKLDPSRKLKSEEDKHGAGMWVPVSVWVPEAQYKKRG
jgi:hypothetical protein